MSKPVHEDKKLKFGPGPASLVSAILFPLSDHRPPSTMLTGRMFDRFDWDLCPAKFRRYEKINVFDCLTLFLNFSKNAESLWNYNKNQILDQEPDTFHKMSESEPGPGPSGEVKTPRKSASNFRAFVSQNLCFSEIRWVLNSLTLIWGGSVRS